MTLSRTCVLALFICVLCTWPSSAHADGFITPGVGVSFGTPSAPNGQPNVVIGAGWIDHGPIGFDIDTTFAPNFFGRDVEFGSNNVTTVTGNVIISAVDNRGGYRRFRRFRTVARPYLTFGVGVMHENIANPSASAEDVGADIGVGVMAVPRHRIGLRADLRYFRDFVNQGNGNTAFGPFHFWRASVALAFRFGVRD